MVGEYIDYMVGTMGYYTTSTDVTSNVSTNATSFTYTLNDYTYMSTWDNGTSSTSHGGIAFVDYINDYGTNLYVGSVRYDANGDYSFRPETEGERAARLKKRQKAEARALRLLRQVIGSHRFKQWQRVKYIEVTAPSGVKYRIASGSAISVLRDDGKVAHRLCVIPAEGLPDIDLLIQEYLMLSTREGERSILGIGRRFAA